MSDKKLWNEFVALEKERDAMRAELDALKKQEPVAWRTFDGEGGYDYRGVDGNEGYRDEFIERNPNHATWVEPLYPRPVPAQSVPSGWLQVMDDALICKYLGVAKEADSYDAAKEKLDKLIAWHVATATDPTVNGGYKPAPTEPTWRAIEAQVTGAEKPSSHAFDDSATIAGLESAVTHLSVLLDSFRALLVEVNDVCGRDGHGGQLEDGESEIIDKVRAAISMTEAPPCAKGEEK